MTILKLSKIENRICIREFELESQVIYDYFSKISEKNRDEELTKAIHIGVLALMEDRISAFLTKTNNQLGAELEYLKVKFDQNQKLFLTSSLKGDEAEAEIIGYLGNYCERHNIEDVLVPTGTMAGKITQNKTGDIVCYLNGDEDVKIAIESKFDKKTEYKDIKDKDIFTSSKDTAWSQLIETDANRDAKVSIIVFDISVAHDSIVKNVENVRYIAGIGFVVIVDSLRGDYSNLSIAYSLARDIALSTKEVELDKEILEAIINRIIAGIGDNNKLKDLVKDNISNNKKILLQLEKNLLFMDLVQKYLSKFLNDGTLTKKDLLKFYMGEEVHAEFKSLKKDVNAL